jgi:hypothetical protein
MSDTLDALKTAAASGVFTDEFIDQRGVTKHLRNQIDRLAEVDIHRAGPNGWLGFVCEQSSRIAYAMARVQSSNAQVMRAMERWRKPSN